MMETWDWKPGQIDLPYLPLVTLPAKASWKCLVTCTDLYLPHTHWVHGRTLPCLGESCGACLGELPRRPEGFVSVILAHNRQHQILRLTRDAAIVLMTAAGGSKNVRGMVFSLSRRGGRANGFVQAVVEETSAEVRKMPDPPDLLKHLCRVWRIDGWEPVGELIHYAEGLRKMIEEKSTGGLDHEAA